MRPIQCRNIFCLALILIFKFANSQVDFKAKADSLYQLGNFNNAIEYYKSAPESPATAHAIAMSYQSIGNYQQAIDILEKILEQDSSRVLSKYELGKLYLRTSDLNNAKKHFEELVERDSSNPNYHYQLGKIRRGLKDSLFIDSFKHAVAIDQSYIKAIEEIAKFYLQRKELETTIEYCDQGLAVYDGNTVLLGYKGQAHFIAGEDSLAIVSYEKLKDMGIGNETIFGKLAYSYYNLRNYEEAINNCLLLLEIRPESSEYHYLLGLNYYETNEFDKAAHSFETAVELKKVSSSNEYLRLVDIYKQQKDYKNAIKYYKLLVSEVPDYILGFYQIAYLGDQYYKDPELKIYHYKYFLSKASTKSDEYLEKYKEYAQQRVIELRTGIHFDTDDG